MSYREITELEDDGSTITYKVYKRNRWIAFILAITLGALGVHHFYTRHSFEGFAMWFITFSCLALLPSSSWWSNLFLLPPALMAIYFVFASQESFDNYVNER
jgi:TM2 domain-containing membrane protein YozV